jgi:Acetyltransferase (GNAT) domain
MHPIMSRSWARAALPFARSSVWWQARALADPDWRRGSAGDLQCAVVENEGRPAAYALYRMNSAFERGLQTDSVAVIEAMGDAPQATRAILRYLCDIDWLAREGLALAAGSPVASLNGRAAPALPVERGLLADRFRSRQTHGRSAQFALRHYCPWLGVLRRLYLDAACARSARY